MVRDMTALTLDTIGLCGFDYRFNSFYRSDNHPFVESLVRALEAVMKMRGLPLEDITQRKSRKKLEQDVGFMNGMVDRIIRERREVPADGAASDQARPAELHAEPASTSHSGERLDDVNIRYQMQHLPDRRPRDHERAAVLRDLLPAQQSARAARRPTRRSTACSGRDLDAKPTLRAGQPARLYRPDPEGVAAAVADRAGLRALPVQERDDRREVQAAEAHLRHRADGDAASRPVGVGTAAPRCSTPTTSRREARGQRCRRNAYKPFGNGQRACIGRQFAMQEATLVLGMILQRFQLIDHTRYQLKIKETLTIKPEGLDDAREAAARRRARHRACASPRRPAPKKAAPKKAAKSHGTKLTVLFGSNLGTAEELARSIAESGEAQGFDTTLAGLDDYAGKLPTEGAVAIVCASYNGGPPDNAGAFINGCARPRRARCRACATPCSAAATATGPRPTRRSRARSTSAWPPRAPSGSMPRGEGDAKRGPRRPLPGLERAAAGRRVADKLGVDARSRRRRGAGAALPGAGRRQAAGQSHHRRHRCAAHARAGQPRTAEAATPRAARRGTSRCCCPMA